MDAFQILIIILFIDAFDFPAFFFFSTFWAVQALFSTLAFAFEAGAFFFAIDETFWVVGGSDRGWGKELSI